MAIVHFVNYKRGTQSRAAMRGVMLYVMQEKKTTWEDELLISGINCQVQSVYDDFLNTKLLYHKGGGVMFYHTLCSILSDAVEGGFLSHNPAWRTYRYAGRKCEKKIADEETAQKIIAALEGESIKYETYFKLIIATGMRRGECCGLKWCDIDWEQRSIHICRNAVKVTNEEIFVKAPKTHAGNRYVYFSAEMESLLREYRQECAYITETYDQRELTADDFLFRRQGAQLPMTPTTFTYRFKLILKKNNLPQELNVHSLRHTAASLMIAGGTDVATVAGILGHSQPSTTLDIYTHAFDKNKKAASAGLQEMLEI